MKQPRIALVNFTGDKEALRSVEDQCTVYHCSNEDILGKKYPYDIIVTVCNRNDIGMVHRYLCDLPIWFRRMWYNYDTVEDLCRDVGRLKSYFVNIVGNVIRNGGTIDADGPELVSVFSTSYKSKDYIHRPYNSLLGQTYRNWEWVVVDDTGDPDGSCESNFDMLRRVLTDNRVRIYRGEKNSGVIGEVKDIAVRLCRGKYVIELDHDDEIVPELLEWVVGAFRKYPDAGFVYSDFAEVYSNGDSYSYGEMFNLGYGAYINRVLMVGDPTPGGNATTEGGSNNEKKDSTERRERWVKVCRTSPVNSVTMRHIVGVPNHVRCWRKDVLERIGGWNYRLHVADDYDTLMRTFLGSRMVRIPRMGYYQYRNPGGNNFTFIRNEEIQKIVHELYIWYGDRIDRRIEELGGSNEIWNMGGRGYGGCRKAWKFWEPDRGVNYDYVDPVVEREEVIVLYFWPCDFGVVERWLNKYSSKNILCIGVECGGLDEIPSKTDISLMKNVGWWNLSGDNDLVDCKNYIAKMISCSEKNYFPQDIRRPCGPCDLIAGESDGPEGLNGTVCVTKEHFDREGYFKRYK